MNRNLDNPMAVGAADAYERSEKPIPEWCWEKARELVIYDMDTFTDWLCKIDNFDDWAASTIIGQGAYLGGEKWQLLRLLLTTRSANAMAEAADLLVEQYLTDQALYVEAEARALAEGDSA